MAFSLSKGRGPGESRPREDDQAVLSAILTLLPELQLQSLKMVIDACVDLCEQ
jgi:predicted RNA binding protein with dsRBD fold (UPF0201 family)